MRRATIGIDTAKSLVTQREAEAATAVVAQRNAELDSVDRKLQRSEQLIRTNAVPRQVLDDDRATANGGRAAVAAAEAQLAASEAAIGAAEAQVVDAEAAVDAAKAVIKSIKVHTLKGEYPVARGLTIGHEPVGVIEKLGSEVRRFHEGQRVTAGAITPSGYSNACQCGRCSQDGPDARHGWKAAGG